MDLITTDTFYLTATSLIGFIGLIGINSRNSTSMLRVRSPMAGTCTLCSRLEPYSERFFLKWASMKCQLQSLLKALSGTSTLFSNRKATLRETCMIPSS